MASDVFLSYARDDRAVAGSLADALRQRGWSVFWDYDIRAGDDWTQCIASEVQDAGCVVVLWSRRSVDSEWVRKEAEAGAERKRLVPVLLEAASLPGSFAALNGVSLIGWRPGVPHEGFRDLLENVVGMIGGEPWKRQAFEAALRNVTRRGDTDVLPYPIETQIFADKSREALELLQRTDAKFNQFVRDDKPYYEASLYPAGFSGYRWVTQIDPLWNAYLLGLVTAAGSNIEAARVPVEAGVVFSYRFGPDEESGDLFSSRVGWEQYQKRSLALAKELGYVVVCDIADFYPRISHDHVRQSLEDANVEAGLVERIGRLLPILSGGAPYGLPVGGPAARLLSELVLSPVDDRLRIEGVTFCRYADDYHIFAKDKGDAYQKLMLISETLFGGLGLVLQKSKTRIMTGKEFLSTSRFNVDRELQTENEEDRWALLKLKIPFDVYSEDRIEKYEKLRAEINRYDLLGILARELAKARPDPAITRRLIDAVRFLSRENRNVAAEALLEKETLERLYPLLSHLLRTFKYLVEPRDGGETAGPDEDHGLDARTREAVFDRIGELITSGSYLMGIPAHLAYAVRVLVHDPRKGVVEPILANVYRQAPSMVRRDVILGMAMRHSLAWLQGLLPQVKDLSPWARRALLIASFTLGGAGQKWRRSLEGTLSPLDQLAIDWAQDHTGPDGLRFRL